jgi:parallel beta-helix repeat protein
METNSIQHPISNTESTERFARGTPERKVHLIFAVGPIQLCSVALTATCWILSAHCLFAQGSLTPPGAFAPTMKTLQQIEPRIDLQNAPAPAVATTDANCHFIINQPGSYYLSANLGVSKTNGIQINAEGVTIDLNGFEIARTSGTGGTGIEIPATGHRAAVRNGSIKGFNNGVQSILVPDFAHACAFRDLSVSGCTDYGLRTGKGAVLESCRAHDNSGTSGIYAGIGSTLSNCSASSNASIYGIFAGYGSSLGNCSACNNTGDYGIFADRGSSVSNCSANGNTTDYGIYAKFGSSLSNCSATDNSGSYGIFADYGSSLSNCTAYENDSAAAVSAGIATGSGCTLTGCSSGFNYTSSATPGPTTGMGFFPGYHSTIQNCTANSNQGNGIYLFGDSVVRENTCNGNGSNGDGAGIHATGDKNRIDSNSVTNNDRGLDVDGINNLIIRNNAVGNGANYSSVGSGNVVGPIVGNTSPISSTSPWANFSF